MEEGRFAQQANGSNAEVADRPGQAGFPSGSVNPMTGQQAALGGNPGREAPPSGPSAGPGSR